MASDECKDIIRPMSRSELAERSTPTKHCFPDKTADEHNMAFAGDTRTLQVQLRNLSKLSKSECRSSEDLTDLIDEASFVDKPDRDNARKLFVHSDLHEAINNFVLNTDYFSRHYGDSYGRIEYLGHAGALRDWYNYDDDAETIISPSWHYEARALDIKWIGWREENSSMRRASRPCDGFAEVDSGSARYRRLVAVEAGLRKWFGTVLNRHWKNHDNHFHVDCGDHVHLNLRSTRRRSSHASFIQDCVDAFTDYRVGDHDGIYGTKTKVGYLGLLSDLGMDRLDPVSNVNEYYLLLDYIMMHGFANKRAGFWRWEGGPRVL